MNRYTRDSRTASQFPRSVEAVAEVCNVVDISCNLEVIAVAISRKVDSTDAGPTDEQGVAPATSAWGDYLTACPIFAIEIRRPRVTRFHCIDFRLN